MNPSLKRAGGFASLLSAALYIVGFALFIFVMDGEGYEGVAGQLAYARDNAAMLTFAMIALYLVFGAGLLVLSGSLRELLRSAGGSWSDITNGFGISWAVLVFASGMIGLIGLSYVTGELDQPEAAVATIWTTINLVQDGLGGGIEFVGGVWIGLVSWLALKSGKLPKALNWLGLGISLAGIATALPLLRDLAAVFGLAQIIWFLWLGIVLLRSNDALTQQEPFTQTA